MNDDWKTSAAHHEAGHVIIALSRGIKPNYVQIEYNPDHRRWEGTTELPELTGETYEKLISGFAICFAGCFAQVKHAIQTLGSTGPVPWPKLLDWTIHQSQQPLDLSLSDGRQLQIPSWWFEGGDKQTFEYLAAETINELDDHRFWALLQQAVRHTAIAVLEDTESWSKVEVLAALLVGSANHGVARVYPAEYP